MLYLSSKYECKNLIPSSTYVLFYFSWVENIINQNVNAFDNSGIRFIASLNPYQIVSEDRNYDRDSNGIAYLSIILLSAKYRMKFFWMV